MTLDSAVAAYDFDDVKTSEHDRHDEEVVMQVHTDDGRWHRTLPDGTETACGLKFDHLRSAYRREELVGNLCDVCFTVREIDIALNSRPTPDWRPMRAKNGEEK